MTGSIGKIEGSVEVTDEALAEEGDIEGQTVSETIARCQVLMLLGETLFNKEYFEEEFERIRKKQFWSNNKE